VSVTEDENVQWFSVLLAHDPTSRSTRVEKLSAFDEEQAVTLAVRLAADELTGGDMNGWRVVAISLDARS